MTVFDGDGNEVDFTPFGEVREEPDRGDVSRRALSIARLVDRLPEGTFDLRLVKRDNGWTVHLHRLIHYADAEFRK